MSMEKLKCPTCEHYRLCSIGGLTDNRARTCKAYHMSKVPIPSAPRPIHSPVDHYDVDVTTGTVTYHVVKTNGDRIRSMTDEDLMRFLLRVGTLENRPWCDDEPCNNRYCSECITEWLKKEVQDG